MSLVGERWHLWIEGVRVVAAVRITANGYYWCQSMPSDDLAARALLAAKDWNVSPRRPPREGDWPTWLRIVLPLAGERERRDDPVTRGDAPPSDPDGFVRQLVESGLRDEAPITTLSWPTLDVQRHQGAPRPDLARELLRRVEAIDRGRRDVGPVPPGSDVRAVDASDGALLHPRGSHHALEEAEFVSAITDGARAPHLHQWADSLLNAVVVLGSPNAGHAFGPLAALLEHVVRLRRYEIDPFAGFLEAPPSVVNLYQRHGHRMEDLAQARERTYAGLLAETAASLFRELATSLNWSQLIEAGAQPGRPVEPVSEWDDV